MPVAFCILSYSHAANSRLEVFNQPPTLQCASAVYHTSGTSWGTGGESGGDIVTDDSLLRAVDELESASLSARAVMLSSGATLAL